MTVRLRLVCHAPTAATHAAAFPGDEPLDPRVQAKLAGLDYSFRRVDQCWTSPALAARQTAGALGLGASLAPQLRGCDYGRWTGQSFASVQANEPDAIAAWLSDPEAAPHGGESIATLIGRVGAWLDDVGALPGKAVAVTHASVIRAAIVHAIEADPRSFWRLDVAPLCVAALNRHGGRWTLSRFAPLKARSPSHTISPETERS